MDEANFAIWCEVATHGADNARRCSWIQTNWIANCKRVQLLAP